VVAALHNLSETSCQQLGKEAEDRFVRLRGQHIIRRATAREDTDEHWDVLDDEFGRIDVKSAKRMHRGGEIDYTVWWELQTVPRVMDGDMEKKPRRGWGVGNGVRRYIAVCLYDGFYLLSPEEIASDLRLKRMKEGARKGRGAFLYHNRRGDYTTVLPEDYVRNNARHYLPDW
jgi:hypothetical protein